MRRRQSRRAALCVPVALLLHASIFNAVCAQGSSPPSIVGTWLVKDSAAPFPYHMYVFHADGTMSQSDPDAGDARSSDSGGTGIWVLDGSKIRGKWVEITADRVTHKFTGRGEFSFHLTVNGKSFDGDATMRFYDVDGRLTGLQSRPR